MKKVLSISLMSVLLLMTGCLYSPATYEPDTEEQEVLDVLANDSTAVVEEFTCVAVNSFNPEYKESFIDTVDDFLSLEADSLTTVGDTLDNVVLSIVSDTTEKYKMAVSSSYLSGYAKLDVSEAGIYDFWMDVHGEITIWDDEGVMVDYDSHSMSSALAMNFKLYTSESVVREHYVFTLESGTYYIRFQKAENSTYKALRFFSLVIN